MGKAPFYIKKKGFLLVEVVLSASVFVLLLTALVGAYLYGQESTALAGNRARAVLFAEEALEAARNIGENQFDSLVPGTYGLILSGNQWMFSGTEDSYDIFDRRITISAIDSNKKTVAANVTWQQNAARSGTLTLETRLTNWHIPRPISCANEADDLSVDAANAVLTNGSRRLRSVMLENTDSSCDITITAMTVSWTPLAPTGRRVSQVSIGGSSVWTGSAGNGSTIDITDTVLPVSSGQTELIVIFNGGMAGKTFSITFIMIDGTTKTISGIAP